MSKYISQLKERDIKEFAKSIGYELKNTHIHQNCATMDIKKPNGYVELNFVLKDFTVRARNSFGTSELYEAEIETNWRLFLKKKFKKEYKSDFIAWLDEQRYLIVHSNLSL